MPEPIPTHGLAVFSLLDCVLFLGGQARLELGDDVMEQPHRKRVGRLRVQPPVSLQFFEDLW